MVSACQSEQHHDTQEAANAATAPCRDAANEAIGKARASVQRTESVQPESERRRAAQARLDVAKRTAAENQEIGMTATTPEKKEANATKAPR